MVIFNSYVKLPEVKWSFSELFFFIQFCKLLFSSSSSIPQNVPKNPSASARYAMYYEFETRGVFSGYTASHFGPSSGDHMKVGFWVGGMVK
jgi:hypothetical protein